MHGLGDASASGAGIAWLRAVHIEFVRDAVLSGVGALVNVAIVSNAPEQFLRPLLVALFGGANEVVVRDSHPLPELAKFRGNFIRVLLRRFAGSLRRAFNLLAVLISSSQEKSIGAKQSLPPRHGVAGDGGVGMANVWPRVHVVNRGRDVELSAHADAILVLGFCAKM